MVEAVGPAGADDGQIVGVLRDFRIPITDPHATLAVLLPHTRRGHERVVAGAHSGDELAERRGHRLAGHLIERGLRIEEIDVAGTAFHEQPDDRFGLGLEVAGPRGIRVANLAIGAFGEHGAERDRPEAGACVGEKLAAAANVPVMSEFLVHGVT